MVHAVQGSRRSSDSVSLVSGSQIENNGGISGFVVSHSVSPESSAKANKRKLFIGLSAGAIVMAISVAIIVIAALVITGPIGACVIGIGVATLTSGSICVIKDLVGIILAKKAERAAKKEGVELNPPAAPGENAAIALAVGTALTVTGLVLRFASKSITSGVSKTINTIGDASFVMGSNSVFSALCLLLYKKMTNVSDKDIEAMTPEESKLWKEKYSRAVAKLSLGIGVTAIVTGITIAVLAGVLMTGPAAPIVLAIGAPICISGAVLLWKSAMSWPKKISNELKNECKSLDDLSSDSKINGTGKQSADVDTNYKMARIRKLRILLAVAFFVVGCILLSIASAGLVAVVPTLIVALGSTLVGISVPTMLAGVAELSVKAYFHKIKKKTEDFIKRTQMNKAYKSEDYEQYVNSRKEAVSTKIGLLIAGVSVLIGIALICLVLIGGPITPIIASLLAVGSAIVIRAFLMLLSHLISVINKKIESYKADRARDHAFDYAK